MTRILSALAEWLQLRARVREERRFHLDRAAADLEALGLKPRQANRTARRRFGSRRNSRAAFRELGGDLQGLAHLFRAHRVVTSLWLQPAILLAGIALILAISPSPREIAEGILGRTFLETPEAVALEVYGAGPTSPGITQSEFEALQSMSTVTRAEIAGPHQVRGLPVRGASVADITAEARLKTGNPDFYASWIPRPPRVMTSPAKVIWLLIATFGAFFLYTRPHVSVTPRWLAYAIAVVCLHSLISIVAWALATQLWGRLTWPNPAAAGLSFSFLVVTYLLSAAIQCLYWWRDLRHRCPVCLDRLLLSWTHGEASRLLMSTAVTESVCAHGHGALIESRWSRGFQCQHGPLGNVARI